MVGIAGPSGGRFCAKTQMGPTSASKTTSSSRKLLLLHTSLMNYSPLRIADQAFDPRSVEHPPRIVELFQTWRKTYVVLSTASTSIRIGPNERTIGSRFFY